MAGKNGTPDFGGWATRNNLECSDGRVICRDAFAVQDGARVPLVWNHEHNDPSSVLGHAILHNRDEGVWADCYFNDGEKADAAKRAVQHGDVDSMSIWANKLKQDGRRVLHGMIREVSLVLAGANPGALIESVAAHGYALLDDEDEGIIYTGENFELYHADDKAQEKASEKSSDEKKEEPAAKKDEADDEDGDETVQDVLDTLNPKQKRVVNAVIGMALESAAAGGTETGDEDNTDNEEEEKMSHNAFETNNGAAQEGAGDVVLSHSDVTDIMKSAKTYGSLRESWNRFVADRDEPILMYGGVPVVYDDNDMLIHAGLPDVPTTDMILPQDETANYKEYGKYGFKNPSMFYPEARGLTSGPPEFIGRDTAWVQEVMGRVHHTPFSRVKSMYANITEDDARAKGYAKKGTQKMYEVFSTLKRVTNPTTIYKLQKLDRDDIIDITDFDVVAWLRGEMRVMLNEEIARAILLGDGRKPGTEGKISEDCIRPIVSDVDLFNVKVNLEFEPGTTADKKAEKVIDGIIRAHKKYHGSGNPTLFTTEDWLTEMLLLKDNIGHRLYKTEAELATALRVSKIVTVEVMEAEEYKSKFGADKKQELIGVIVNLADYNIGQDPKGGISMFDDFDIDFNQQKYLIETRMSGALIKPFSAITITAKESGE